MIQKGVSGLICSKKIANIFYTFKNREGDENNHIYQTDIATGTTVNLTPYPCVRTRMLEHNKFHPNELVFIMNKRDKTISDVYKINLDTHETIMIQDSYTAAHDWIVSADLEIKGVAELNEQGSLIIKLKKSDDSWKTIFTWDYEDMFNCDVSHISVDGKTLYILDSSGKNTAGLYSYDIATGKKTLITEHPTAEIESCLIDSNTGEPLAIQFYTSRSEWELLDESLQEDFTIIHNLHHGDFFIVNKTEDQQKWIVAFNQDTGPTVWYLYDRLTKTGTKLFYDRPDLLQYKLQPMHPISFLLVMD